MHRVSVIFVTTSIFYISVNAQALSSDACAAVDWRNNSKKASVSLREKEAHTHLKQCQAERCNTLVPEAR
jgi:hypothetical protein